METTSMNFHHSNSRLRFGLTLVALVATVGLASCRLVENSVTGPDRTNSAFGNDVSKCVQKCQEAFKACADKEEARYRAALRGCDALPKAQQKACKETEERRHQQAHDDCVRAMQLCKKNCEYKEGSGNGGR
jgi:hypothetical protein